MEFSWKERKKSEPRRREAEASEPCWRFGQSLVKFEKLSMANPALASARQKKDKAKKARGQQKTHINIH
jgi:hypothetical protein